MKKTVFMLLLLVMGLFGDFVKVGDVVQNNDNSLVYSDDAVSEDSWSNAINYCETLVLDGADDWRLPNIKELLFIMGGFPQRDSSYPNSLNGAFTIKSPNKNYWSSTTRKSSTNEAYLVNAIKGIAMTSDKTTTNGIICVRGE